MSELKERKLGRTMNEYGCDTEIYLKSEADKVITKLQSKLTLARLADDRRSLRNKRCNYCSELQRHKYKRCMKMVDVCDAKIAEYRARYDADEGFGDEWLYWIRFMRKWMHRWLELAKQFKEAK